MYNKNLPMKVTIIIGKVASYHITVEVKKHLATKKEFISHFLIEKHPGWGPADMSQFMFGLAQKIHKNGILKPYEKNELLKSAVSDYSPFYSNIGDEKSYPLLKILKFKKC